MSPFKTFTSISEIRVTAKSVYLCIHKYEPLTKNEIHEKLGSSLANITRFLMELHKDNLILKSESRGRLSAKYRVNPDAAYAFGGYINGDVIGLGLCDIAGNIIAKYEGLFEDADTPEKALDFFKKAHSLLKSNRQVQKSLGTSIAIVGPMDKERDLLVFPPNMPKWEEVPFKKMYEESISAPMIPELFAEAILIGELFFEDHEIDSNILLFWLDEGIGASLSHLGRMDLNRKDRSKILGHQIVDFNGVPCHCGKRGCLANYGTIPSFRRAVLPFCHIQSEEIQNARKLHKDNPWRYSADLEIVNKIKKRNQNKGLMDAFFEDFEKAYFAGLWNTFNGINPDNVIFCGRLSEYYKENLKSVMSRIINSENSETKNLKVQWLKLDSTNIIRGSAARVFNSYLNIVE